MRLLISLVLLLSASSFADPPNIVFLVADDMRWDAMGAAGNDHIYTPNLDRLAAQGTRFTNAFATTAICCTSRVSLLTGMYASTHGIDDFATPIPEPLIAQTYPALLRDAGYFTGFTGKWGIGGPLPVKSFDVFDGFSGQGKYFNDVDGETVHMTTLISRQANEFLRKAPADRPFCLSVSFKAPHVQDDHPRQFLPDPNLEYLYADKEIPIPETATPAMYDAMPAFIRDSEMRNRWKRRFADPAMHQRSLRDYYALVSGVDRAVGELRATLEELGRAENTIVIFTSDHGFFLGEYGLAGKWLMHDASIRVPLIVFDPRIPHRDHVHGREEMALLIDLAPTILAFAVVDVPVSMQGRDLAPLLRAGLWPWRDAFFYEHHFGSDRPNFIPANEGVRMERWKYIRYVGVTPVYEELYDLDDDPLETRNLAYDPAHAERRAELAAARRAWNASFVRWDDAASATWKEPR